MDITLFVIILSGVISTFLAAYSKIKADRETREADRKVTEIQQALNQEALSLSNLLLMKEEVSSTVRAVFSFKSPINVLSETETRKFKEQNLPPSPSLHYSKYPSKEGAYNIYTFNRHPSTVHCIIITAHLGNLGEFHASVMSGFAMHPCFVYYEEDLQHAAFEMKGNHGSLNLARFYTQIRQPTNFLTLRKNYPVGVTEDSVITEEKRFVSENVSLSIECPIIESKGIWHRVNLKLVDQGHPYRMVRDNASDGAYIYTEYKWVVEKNNGGFIFNKVESSIINVDTAK